MGHTKQQKSSGLWFSVGVCVCVCVGVYVRACVRGCVCVRERESTIQCARGALVASG